MTYRIQMGQSPDIFSDSVEVFITRWQGQEGGQERANYALFLTELCDMLRLPHPDPADASHERNDYVFERVVTRHRDDEDRRNVIIERTLKGTLAVAKLGDILVTIAKELPVL